MSIEIRNKKVLVVMVAAALSLGASNAFSQDHRDDRYDDGYDQRYDHGNDDNYDDRNYDDRNDDGRDQGDAVYDYAKVVDVQPLTTRVRISTPQRECWDEKRYETGGYAPGPHGPQVAGSTLLGAAIGAVIGHNLGHGHHRDETAVAGAIVGGAIGHQQGMSRYGQQLPAKEYTVQRCETRYHDEYQERVEGYRVTYLYHGRRQVTELPYRPGERIRVRVDVSPAE